MPQDSVGSAREGQFGAIGTRREQRPVAGTQPPSLKGAPDINSFTAPNNSSTSAGNLLEFEIVFYYQAIDV